MRRTAGIIASVSLVLLGLVGPAEAVGKRIVVTTTADEFGGPGSTGCAMREAVQSANTNQNFGGCKRRGSGAADTIKPEGGQLYQDARAGVDDTNENGDLDITGKTTIEVRGEGRATLDGNDLDRVIEVHPGAALEASRVIVTKGSVTGDGGGIETSGRTVLRNVAVTLNEATAAGGGIAASDGRLVLRNSEVAGNKAVFFGGGLYIIVVDSAAIGGSTINDNQSTGANGEGGGIYYAGNEPPTTITNATISGNEANSRGGGINVYDGALRLNAVTVTDNTADLDGNGGGTAAGDGGGLNLVTAGVSGRVINSIIARNHATNSGAVDCAGSVSLPFGRNLVGDDTGCPEAPGNFATADPMMGPLGDYGGPTQTHELMANSPAIGKAGRKSAPSKDQRGVERDRRPDIGAYER